MPFSASGIKAVSEIARDVGQVLFASVFIGTLVDGSANTKLVILGLILALSSWAISISVASLTSPRL